MLKDLKIIVFDELQHLSNEFFGHSRKVGVNRNTAFMCLESLHLMRLPILEDWLEVEKEDLPCLTKLHLPLLQVKRQCLLNFHLLNWTYMARVIK